MRREDIIKYEDFVVCTIEKLSGSTFTGKIVAEDHGKCLAVTIFGSDGFNLFDYIVDQVPGMDTITEHILHDSAFWKTSRYELHQLHKKHEHDR